MVLVLRLGEAGLVFGAGYEVLQNPFVAREGVVDWDWVSVGFREAVVDLDYCEARCYCEREEVCWGCGCGAGDRPAGEVDYYRRGIGWARRVVDARRELDAVWTC